MPEIVDPHIHLWDPRTTPRLVSPLVKSLGWSPWLLERAARLLMPRATVDFVGRPDHVLSAHLPGTYRRDAGKYTVTDYVHVQAGWVGKQPLDAAGETRWLETLDDPPVAIVGEVRLHAVDVLDDVLDAHQAASPRFQGVRDMIAQHPSPGVMDFNHRTDLLRREDFQHGYALLAERGLSFDAWLYSHQLPDLIDLVREIPGTRVVLDHLGTPIALAGPFGGLGQTQNERSEIKDQWYENLSLLAEVSHVCVKLSGLLMPVVGHDFHRRDQAPEIGEVVDAIAPHIEYALSLFGVDRCLFASNFPMDKVSTSFETLYDAYFQIVSGYSDADKQKLFGDNALKFYQQAGPPRRSATGPNDSQGAQSSRRHQAR